MLSCQTTTVIEASVQKQGLIERIEIYNHTSYGKFLNIIL